MYLCGIDRSWMDTPFLRHRFLIRSSSDLTELRQCGIQEITIDTDRGLDDTSAMKTQPHEETPVTTPPDPPRVQLRRPSPPQVERIQHLPQEVQGKSLGGELTSITQTRQ